jgi:putative spermidine/putrescine transport system permease protein
MEDEVKKVSEPHVDGASTKTVTKRAVVQLQPGRGEGRSGWEPWLLPMLAVLTAIFAIPIVNLISVSFHEMSAPAQVGSHFTLANYRVFVGDPFFLRIVLNTSLLGAFVATCCLIIGYPISYFLARTQSKLRGMFIFLVISPLLVSAVVRNIGWFPILGESGLINWLLMSLGIIDQPLVLIGNYTGVAIGLIHALSPFMILTIMTVIQRVDPELEEAAANLGAGPIETFFRVLLPLSLPGVVAGLLIVFTMAISAYTTPVIMGGGKVLVMATYIAQQFLTVLDYGMGASAAAVLMIASTLLTLGALRLRTKEAEGA